MIKEITSKIIGRMLQDESFSECWKSEEIAIPFFDHIKLPIIFMGFEPEHDQRFIEEADQALKHFLNLSSEDRYSISELVYLNCMDVLDTFDDDEADETFKQIKSKNEIWNFVQPTDIYVKRRPYNEQDIYVQVACECDWDQEHGLQLVFRQGKKLTRVSAQDGHLTEADAHDKPDADDELLSKFYVELK